MLRQSIQKGMFILLVSILPCTLSFNEVKASDLSKFAPSKKVPLRMLATQSKQSMQGAVFNSELTQDQIKKNNLPFASAGKAQNRAFSISFHRADENQIQNPALSHSFQTSPLFNPGWIEMMRFRIR